VSSLGGDERSRHLRGRPLQRRCEGVATALQSRSSSLRDVPATPTRAPAAGGRSGARHDPHRRRRAPAPASAQKRRARWRQPAPTWSAPGIDGRPRRGGAAAHRAQVVKPPLFPDARAFPPCLYQEARVALLRGMGTPRPDRDEHRFIADQALLGDLRRSIATFDPVPARARSAAQLAFVVHRRRWLGATVSERVASCARFGFMRGRTPARRTGSWTEATAGPRQRSFPTGARRTGATFKGAVTIVGTWTWLMTAHSSITAALANREDGGIRQLPASRRQSPPPPRASPAARSSGAGGRKRRAWEQPRAGRGSSRRRRPHRPPRTQVRRPSWFLRPLRPGCRAETGRQSARRAATEKTD
jgi:hypothetical protein